MEAHTNPKPTYTIKSATHKHTQTHTQPERALELMELPAGSTGEEGEGEERDGERKLEG